MGILINDNLKSSVHCSQICKRANRMLGLIRRTIIIKDRRNMVLLYKSLVRPILEYASPAWSPHYNKDKIAIERVQRRFTRLIPGLDNCEYMNRLSKLKLWTLEERRNRTDVIEVFKSWKGMSRLPFKAIFELNQSLRTRGHSLKLLKHHCAKDLRKYFFSERVINVWNSLDQETVASTTVNEFKANLDRLRNTKMGVFQDRP